MKKNNRTSFANRLRYGFDKTISRGPLALGGWVALFSLGLILVLAVLAHLASLDPQLDFPQILWTMLLQALAPNPVDISAGPWSFLMMMLVVTLLGIFMVSIFIGIITTGIEDKIQFLRKGRSHIIEKDQTVILGWDEHIFTIIRELIIANERRSRSCIAIMGEKDKVEMEDAIRARIGRTNHTEIVCRSGSPIDIMDLEIVSLNTAKSIIVLAPEGDEADSVVIKTLLAITNNPRRKAEPYNIVTEIQDSVNMEVARLVGKNEAVLLLISDIIAHITAQTCRQSGLSVVYTELMNFEDDEIYIKGEPSLVGRTFGDILALYEGSAVIGLDFAGGKPRLNPSMNTVICPGDRIIAISEDEKSMRLSGIEAPPLQVEWMKMSTPDPAAPELTLILGWNMRGLTIIGELDHHVPPGSAVMVVAAQAETEAALHQLQATLKNQAVTFRVGNITSRRFLNSLTIDKYHHVIVLADLDDTSVQLADARTLITLLHLRDINERAGRPFSIVSEMLDVRNRDLAEITHVDDFIVSDELASLLMAQIAENKELSLVFDDLFYPEGSEIYLKPAADYICLDKPVNFYTIVEAARQRGEVALGYRVAAHAGDPDEKFGVVMNPPKSNTVVFQAGDRVIVLAEV